MDEGIKGGLSSNLRSEWTFISGDKVFPLNPGVPIASFKPFPTLRVTTNFLSLKSQSSSSSSASSFPVSPFSEYTLHSISSSLSSTLFNLDCLTSTLSFNLGFFTILPEAVYSTTSLSPLFLPLRRPPASSSSSSSSSDFPNSE